MEKYLIVGNPNTGKTTFFNSITKSNEHIGNYHGVTVDKKSKIVKCEGKNLEVCDLPGMYSLNSFSMEEEVAKNSLTDESKILYLVNPMNFKRNMYLCLQLLKQNKNIKICINDIDEFKKNGGKIDEKKLSKLLQVDCVFVDARKQKLNKSLINFSSNQLRNENSFLLKLKNSCTVEEIYGLVEEISRQVYTPPQKENHKNQFDQKMLKMHLFLPLFLLFMFFSLYLIFFLIGPKISSILSLLLETFVANPLKFVVFSIFKNGFVFLFFEEAVINSSLTICSFLPQVFLLYLFLNVLEESGIISRFAFMFDDFLNKVGLNGKCVYTMLMGFGCNTSSCFTCKNMSDNNSKIKTAILTPFMSCTAKLPIYTVVAGAILGANNFWLIFGLYVLGFVVGIGVSFLLEKTVLKSKSDNFIIEFPLLKFPLVKNVFKTSILACKQFAQKVFAVIVTMSAVLWFFNNVNFKFLFVEQEKSILFTISKHICWIFKPIGLNNPAIVVALITGLVAKELVVSTMLIFNKTSSIEALMASLAVSTSPLYFTTASGLSFLVFVLLYAPCLSTIAVMLKEIGKFWTSFSLILMFCLAYLLSMLVFGIASKSFVLICIFFVCLILLLGLIVFANKKLNKNKCKKCVNCSCFNG